MSTLYVIATPIGNLGDISRRAIETLQSVDLIACEDTRHTAKLLHHFGIQKPLTSYHDFNEEERAEELANKLSEGVAVALVSDAGTPAISDPGYRIVRLCRQRSIPVVPIPGANAAVTSLSVSGLPSDEFFFAGFLPAKRHARRAKLGLLRQLSSTLIFYEAPHRIAATLEDFLEVLGDREAFIAREITKLHEQYLYGKLSEVRAQVKELGEFVIVLAGASTEEEPVQPPMTREEVLKRIGMTRNQLYDLLFKK